MREEKKETGKEGCRSRNESNFVFEREREKGREGIGK